MRSNKTVGVLLSLLLLPGCASVLTATRDDDRSTLARLLRNGANPDDASRDGVTPLFEAIEQGNLPVARMLVEGGADVNKRSKCRGRDVTPLHKAAIHGNVALVAYLLDRGADATTLADGHSVFTLMTSSRDASGKTGPMAERILKHLEDKMGHDAVVAFVDKQTPTGWTALAAAANQGDAALVEALLAAGARVDVLARARNANTVLSGLSDAGGGGDEWPPLFFAKVHDHEAVVRRLVAAGADPKQKSRDGLTTAEVFAKMRERRAELAALEAQQERERREREREEAEQNRRTFQAFQQGMQAGLQKSPDNPVDDDSFQRKMMEIQRREAERRAAQNAAPPEPEPAAPSPASTAEAAAAAATASSEAASTGAASGDAPGSSESAPGADASRAAAATAAEAKREEQERKKQEQERKKEEARKKEEERKQEAERRKAEMEEKKRAAQEAERRAWQAYLDALRRGIRLRATKAFCAEGGGYCAVGTMPAGVRWTGSGSDKVDVSFRATCVSKLNWSTGTFYTFVGGGADTAPIRPKPDCPIEDVRVEVTDVR